MRKLFASILVLASIALTGCVTMPGNSKPENAYTSSEVNKALEVRLGKVVAVKEVKVERSGLLGGLAGGMAGSVVGDILGGPLLKVAGAVGGAIAGNRHATELVAADELTLAMEDGKTIAIVQERVEGVAFRHGDRVRVISNGEISRVSLMDDAQASRATSAATTTAAPSASANRATTAPSVAAPQVTPTKAPAPKKRKSKVQA